MNIPLQPASLDIWEKKYCLRDKDGARVDKDLNATLDRVAHTLASVEKTKALRVFHEKSFRDALDKGAIPAGRILSNAGAEAHKKAVSLINCVVSDTVQDSMDSILGKLTEAGMSLKAGCGIGYEFSTLRPKGSYVHGAGSNTSGPLSFMDIYDKMCFTISSAGGRRGAQMATFDVSHPDVLDFISSKRETGRFRQFNLSLLITDEFIRAVKANAVWDFKWEGVVSHSMPAQDLWDVIMRSNYDFAEPGFLLIDKINRFNNLWFCEHLRATNPCGEQPLPPYGSCLLGSLNLTKFVRNPFTAKAFFDFPSFFETVGVFTRMLDNVVPLNGLSLPEQQWELESKRRHGMGYLGLGSAFAMLGLSYGEQKTIDLTSLISKELAMAGFLMGSQLSAEKGEAPALQKTYTANDIAPFLKYNTNFKRGSGPSKRYKGRDLFLKSHYFDVWRDDSEANEVLKELAKHGSRFTHHSSLAPTGTISLSIAGNASNGIEPSFAHSYGRNIIREGRNAKEHVQVNSYEYLAYKTLINPEATPEIMTAEKAVTLSELEVTQSNMLPAYFVTTDDLSPAQHIDIQAAAQTWIDSSISKTINIPQDLPFEEFKNVYMYAYDKGLKGCTTFRFNPEAFQGVLVKAEDLKGTLYQFTLEDGSTVEATGDTLVEYEGQSQTAANLFDAIKENTFGKF